MEMISRDLETLTKLAAKLLPRRNESGLANDMYEAADDWRHLAKSLVEDDGRMMFEAVVQQDEDLWAELRLLYGEALAENSDYASVMAIGARVIAEGKQRKTRPDSFAGQLLQIIPRTFAFLTTEYGLRPGDGPEGTFNYASDRVSVSLDLPTAFDSWCRLKRMSGPATDFTLEDLLFMAGKSASLVLPPGQTIDTAEDIQAWFTTVADILRRYGADVLADKPGAFDRLAKAAAERDRLIGEENERLYGAGAEKG